MIKKALLGAGLLAALGFFVFGSGLFSYARTTATEVRNAIRSEVPIEFEIKRARDLVANLVPEMHQCMREVARQQVELEHMQQDIDERTAALDKQRTEILALRQFLGSDKVLYMPASSRSGYTRDEVERDLRVRFERFQDAEKALEGKRQLVRLRQEALQANKDKLDEMISAKEKLEVQVAELETRLQTLRAVQSVKSLEFDDSQLAQARALIGEINKKIEVEQKLMDAQGHFTGLIPVETEPQTESNVLEQIDAHFSRQPEVKSADVAEEKPAA